MIDRARVIALLTDQAEAVDLSAGSYSGRGMYGARCFSISGEFSEVWSAVMAAQADLTDEGSGDLIPPPRQDSMGLGIVWYWPELSVDEDPEEGDPEEEDL